MVLNGENDPFFPPAGKDSEAVVGYCFRCPVKVECDDKATRIGAEEGIWGGRRRKRQ